MKVPFLELSREAERFAGEWNRAISRVIEAGWYVLGPELEAFEKEFAVYFDLPFAVGTGNGTDALSLALEASGAIVPEERPEVITSALSAAFTAIAIHRAGAIPRFADVDPVTLQMDPASAESLIGPRTRGILAVHLYGNLCDIESIAAIAARHKLPLFEDACQAHGTRRKGRLAGTYGLASGFSFYPTKNLGALGDGGMIITADEGVYRRARKLRHGGQGRSFHHELLGRNSRLDEVQAAVLRLKLENLELHNATRRRMAQAYDEAFADLELKRPALIPETVSNRHLYVIRTERRQALRNFLFEHGIETLIHYPTPLPEQPSLAPFVLPDQIFPAVRAAAGEIVSLPLYPELSQGEILHIIGTVRKFFGEEVMKANEYAPMYEQEGSHWWYCGMRRIVLSLVPPSSLVSRPRMLDAGCGTGYNLAWLREHYGGEVTGLDYFPYGLAFCQTRGETSLVQGDIAALPFAPASFDFVGSFDVLTQLSTPVLRAQALGEFFRVLRPNGTLFIRVAAFRWLRSSHDEELLTYHRYAGRELKSALESAGFRVARFTFANFLLFPGLAAWRVLKKAGLAPAGSDVGSATRGAEWLNRILDRILGWEAALLDGPARSLPFGLSAAAVALKPLRHDG